MSVVMVVLQLSRFYTSAPLRAILRSLRGLQHLAQQAVGTSGDSMSVVMTVSHFLGVTQTPVSSM